MSDDRTEQLEDNLSSLFHTNVDASIRVEHQAAGVQVTLCDMQFLQSDQGVDSVSAPRQVQQTAIVLTAAEMDLPQFVVFPKSGGLLGKVLRGIAGDWANIVFEDSPEFSNAYHLHGWNQAAVRLLIVPQLRDLLLSQPGWSIRGHKQCIVVFQPRRILPLEESEPFVVHALEMLELLRAGEEVLDEHPEINRESKGSDVLNTVNSMSGVAGGMMRRQLKNYLVTPTELETFLRQSPPRQIPSGILCQIAGDNFMLIPIGILFTVIGFVAGAVTLIMSEPGPGQWLGIEFLVFMPTLGGLLAGFAAWHRNKKKRVLRDGRLVVGQIAEIATNNKTTGNTFKIAFPAEENSGDVTTAFCYPFSIGIDHACQQYAEADSVQVLVDPQDSKHIVCAEFIMLFDEN